MIALTAAEQARMHTEVAEVLARYGQVVEAAQRRRLAAQFVASARRQARIARDAA